jgi:hypothetical protein
MAGMTGAATTSRSNAVIGGVALAGACLVGLVLAQEPLFVLGACLALLATAVNLYFPARLSRLFSIGMGVVLFGYAFLGRAFAYLGFPPFFVGEIVLATGLLSVLGRRRAITLRSPALFALVAFMAWGACRTVPYLGTYGMLALRDAVLWGYGVFVLLLVPLLLGPGRIETVVYWYRRCIPLFLVWAPVVVFLSRRIREYLPVAPDGSRLTFMKAGDGAVHLAGIAAFLVLGLDGPTRRRTRPAVPPWVITGLWFVGALSVAALNRGGALALLAAMLLLLVLRPVKLLPRFAGVVAVGATLGLVLTAGDVAVDLGHGRTLSVQQITDNLQSVVDPSEAPALSGTREWRLRWWTAIVDYTIRGPYFWTGKGFGVNLAIDDGFQLARGRLRSPHNGHMSVLARTGVPGAVLWLTLQATLAVLLIRTYVRARRAKDEWWERLSAWVLAYGLAMLVNASFDIYLEGPQGGIWYWSVFALGTAVASVYGGSAGERGSRRSLPRPVT